MTVFGFWILVGNLFFLLLFQLFCYATNNIWSAGFLYIVRCQHEIYLSHMTTFSLAVRLTPLITFRMNKKKNRNPISYPERWTQRGTCCCSSVYMYIYPEAATDFYYRLWNICYNYVVMLFVISLHRQTCGDFKLRI